MKRTGLRNKFLRVFLTLLTSFLPFLSSFAQVNADQVLTIGRNVLSMEDYMLAIQYFNQAIKARPYMADPYFFRAIAKLSLDDYKGAEEDCSLAIERNKFKTEAYKVRGFSRQLQGKDSLALEDYNTGLVYNPLDRYFLFYKALALTELNKYSEADTTFSVLLRQYPSFDDGYSARAKLFLLEGDTVQAMNDIDKAISISKTQINPYLLKAEINWKQKNWPEAEDAIGKAIRLRPEIPDLYVNRAFIRYNSDDFPGAMSDYNYTLELDPNNTAALFNRALLRYEVKDLFRAEEDLTKVLSLDPQNFHALFNRGLIRIENNKNKEALEDFDLIKEKYPRFYPVYYAIGEAKRNLGDMRGAMQSVHYADELVEKYISNPDKNYLDRPTIAAAESNDSRRKDSEEEDPEEVMAKFNRLVTVSDIKENQLSFNERIKGRVQDRDVNVNMEPAYALSIYESPVSLKSLSNYFKELDDLNNQRLLSFNFYLNPGLSSSDFSDRSSSLFELADRFERNNRQSRVRPVDNLALGVIYTMLKNYAPALEQLNEAIMKDPHFVVALMARGFALYSEAALLKKNMENEVSENESNSFLERTAYASRLQEALADFNSALSIDPRLVYAWFNKGNIMYDSGDYNSAVKFFTEALKIDPEFGQAYFNRGLSYLQSGDKNRAFSDLSKAGELGVLSSYNLLKRMQ